MCHRSPPALLSHTHHVPPAPHARASSQRVGRHAGAHGPVATPVPPVLPGHIWQCGGGAGAVLVAARPGQTGSHRAVAYHAVRCGHSSPGPVLGLQPQRPAIPHTRPLGRRVLGHPGVHGWDLGPWRLSAHVARQPAIAGHHPLFCHRHGRQRNLGLLGLPLHDARCRGSGAAAHNAVAAHRAWQRTTGAGLHHPGVFRLRRARDRGLVGRAAVAAAAAP